MNIFTASKKNIVLSFINLCNEYLSNFDVLVILLIKIYIETKIIFFQFFSIKYRDSKSSKELGVLLVCYSLEPD